MRRNGLLSLCRLPCLLLGGVFSASFEELPINVQEDAHPVHPHQPTFGVLVQRLAAALDMHEDPAQVQGAELFSSPEPLDILGLGGPSNGSAPQQIHLALTNRQDEMLVTWITKAPATDPTVWYGPSADGLNCSAQASTATYSVPLSWFNPQGWIGWIHTAKMSGLKPGCAHYYRVGGVELSSPVFAFNSAPPQSPVQRTRLAIYGDQGTYMPLGFMVTDAMIAEHQNKQFDAIFVCGDLSYAGVDTSIEPLNITKNDEWEEVWDLWGRQMEPLSSVMPLLTGVGNHEIFYDWVAFRSRFTMPSSPGSNGNFWFSFNLGNIHVVSFSTEHDYDEGSAQWKWMEADLQGVDRAVTPWVVVSGHRPFYSSEPDYCPCPGEGGKDIARSRIVALEPMLIRHGVDLTVTGHLHCYERVHPNKNATDVRHPVPSTVGGIYRKPPYPVHVVQGNAGGLQEEKWIRPRPAWSAVRYANGRNPDEEELPGVGYNYSDTFGYGRIDAVNATHLHYEYLPVTGGMSDEFWIAK